MTKAKSRKAAPKKNKKPAKKTKPLSRKGAAPRKAASKKKPQAKSGAKTKAKTKVKPRTAVVRSAPPLEEAFRRRLPRITLTAEQFRVTRLSKVFGVADLSAEGMALRLIDPRDAQHFTVGALIEGMLNLKHEKYAARAKVRHLSGGLVGLQFDGPTPELKRALSQLLDPTTLGRELKPLPASEVATVWYHGPSGTDLLFKRHLTGEYSEMSLYTLGRYIQWSEDTGVQTGFTEVTAPRSGESRQTPEIGLVRFETLRHVTDQEPDSEKLQIAKTLILSSKLPQDLKQWCSRVLRGKNGS